MTTPIETTTTMATTTEATTTTPAPTPPPGNTTVLVLNTQNHGGQNFVPYLIDFQGNHL